MDRKPKCDYRIGTRAAKEVWNRVLQNNSDISVEMRLIGRERKAFAQLEKGMCAPSADTLQTMVRKGYDVIYILTGTRSKT